MGSLRRMLNPKGVALIGATDREGSVGQAIMKNLLVKDERKVYPVNPNRERVMGLDCYPSVTKVPEHVDLAVIATPAATVPKVVEECGEAGVDGAVIISAGFRETGEEGRKLEDEIAVIRTKYGMRILGPNCFGVIRPHLNLNTTFLRRSPEPGGIAFISQSGALGSAVFDWAISSHIGFSMFASLGSMLDVDFGDLIDLLGEDPNTKSIIIYMESVGNTRRFMSAARGFARTKPIIVIKPGKFAEGARAALSHTGAIAGSDHAYEAAFKRVGVVRVDEIRDLFSCASALDSRYLPAGPKIAIVTNAGGPGVIGADAVRKYAGELSQLSQQTVNDLSSFLPSYWSHGNPVDVLGDAGVERYAKAVATCVGDPNVDGLVVVYTPQGAAPSVQLAESLLKIADERIKPMLTVWIGEEEVREARRIFYANDVPTYESPEGAIKTYMYMYRYKRNLDLLYETPQELPVDLSPPRNHLKVLIRRVLKEGRLVLRQDEADRFLDAYRIPRPRGTLCRNVEEAAIAASAMRYPVVLKIASPDIVHKVDVGGVVAAMNSEELKEAFPLLIDRVQKRLPKAKIEGIYVQKMITHVNYELIVGSKKDVEFGSVMLFGSGGIGVEVFRDFSTGLPPLNQVLAKRLMEETKIYGVLKEGLRDKPPADLRLLEEIMVKFSNLVVDFPEIAELEINPLAVSEKGIYALDLRIILDPQDPGGGDPYRHLAITPYPIKYVTPWRLKDGTEVLLRPIRPEDEAMEEELIRGFSDETSMFRFFQLVRNITHEMLVRYCNIDYGREMAIIAEHTDAGKKRNIGVGRLIMDADARRGEIAIVVADDFQGKGLGTKLLDVLIGIADEKRLESLYGMILPENKRMIDLCKRFGFDLKYGPEELRAELKLNG